MNKKYICLLKILIVVFFSIKGYSQTSTITLTAEKQVIRGFGGINHPIWAGDLTTEQRNTAFGNGAGQMGMSILRIWVSDNRNQWALELPTAKRAIELGAIVFASPWNPPATMIETFTRGSQTDAKRLKYDMYDEYAQHLNDFVTYMKNNGVDLYAISIQNEPDYAHDWTWWTPEEMLRFMKENAGSINCRVIAPESFQYLKNMSDPILNDPQALANMDILGTHLYGTSYSNFPYPLFKQKGAGKELWMTEVYYPNSNTNSADLWPEALEVGYHMYNAMVEAEFQAYVWWYIRRQYSPMKEDGTISKRGYCMSHYSKFVRPGYVRVDATKNPTTDVYVSAYKKGDDVVMVIVNRGTSPKTITLSLPGTKVTSLEKYVTSASKSLSKEANVNSTTGSYLVTLDAQSITTFSGKAAPGTPTVAITSPANNTLFTAPASITITATASDADGTISKVEFYNGTTKLGEDAASPYTYSWTNVPAGTYTLRAVATDNQGKTAEATVTIKVNAPQGPYNGTVSLIPGTIQAESYDVGGNGYAYNDATAGNTGGASFRTDEDVDLETCTDAGGGYNLGWATAGEWLEYSVNVQTTGVYNLDLRVACEGDGRTISVSMDGTNIASNVAIPNTGGWQTWQTVRVSNISLTAGQKIMRITIGATDYINLNYVTYSLTTPPAATITAAGPTTFCSGGSVVLNANTGTGYTYQWKKDGSNITSATTSSYTATQSGSYTVDVNANGQTATSGAVLVTVNTLPVAPVVSTPVSYCQNTSATPLTATGTNLKWYTVATGGTGTATAPTPSTATAGSTSYYVSQTTNSCEGPRAAIAVTVNALPVITPYVQVNGGTWTQQSTAQLCAGGSVVLGPQPVTTAGWSWTGPSGFTSASREVSLTNMTSTQGGVYTASYTSNGCSSTQTFTITVNNVPDAPVVSSPVTYCQNATATQLTATGSNLKWYTVASGGTSSATAPTQSTATAGTTNYYVSQTDGCESPRAMIAVTVNSVANAPVVSSPVTYCQNATASPLTATGTNLKWYTVASGGTSSATAPTPSTATTGTTNYYVSQTNGCESPRAMIAVTVNSVANAPVVSSLVTYCQNATATQLTATGTNLKWYTVASGGTSSATAPTPSTATAGTTNYYVSQSNGCESARAMIAVTVNAAPEAVITPSGPTTFVAGGSVTLNANTGAGLSYRWFNGTTEVGTEVSYVATSSGSYTVEETNASGCKTTSSATSVTVTQNQPSVIIILSPVPGSTINGSITITVSVSDPDGDIVLVELLDGTKVIGTSAASPYTFTLDTPTPGTHVFAIRATDSNGGVTTSIPVTVTVSVSTEVHAATELQGAVYPNPASGEMTIETAMDLTDAKVSVLNVLGEEIQLQPMVNGKGASVDVSSLTEGTYMLIIKKDNSILRKKISVVK